MGRRIGHRSRSNGRTYIGSSPSPTKIVDTPASITDPRHKPSLIPIKNANRIMTLVYQFLLKEGKVGKKDLRSILTFGIVCWVGNFPSASFWVLRGGLTSQV